MRVLPVRPAISRGDSPWRCSAHMVSWGMGLLDGDIAGLFSDVFGSFYLDGQLAQNPVWVPDGSGGGSYTPADPVAIKYQEDQVDEATRVAGGYSQDDVRFLILQRPGLVLTGDSEITVADGRTYLLRTPRQDPAKSYWEVWGVPK